MPLQMNSAPRFTKAAQTEDGFVTSMEVGLNSLNRAVALSGCGAGHQEIFPRLLVAGSKAGDSGAMTRQTFPEMLDEDSSPHLGVLIWARPPASVVEVASSAHSC